MSEGAIVHVVGWRLNGRTGADRAQQARSVVAAVEATRCQVEGLRSVDVGVNVVEGPEAWDVGAVMVFDSLAALQAYQRHPAHLALKAIVAPLRASRGQFDIVRGGSGEPAGPKESRP